MWLLEGLQHTSPSSQLQYFVQERPALWQLHLFFLHDFRSALELQLTTSRSPCGATGALDTYGVTTPPSLTSQPKRRMSRESTGGCLGYAVFQSIIFRWTRRTCSCRLLSVGGSFFSCPSRKGKRRCHSLTGRACRAAGHTCPQLVHCCTYVKHLHASWTFTFVGDTCPSTML